MTIKEINNLIEEGQSLKEITEAFTQIASSKLKKIRESVLRNREFFKELSNIYGLINIIRRVKKLPELKKNGKTLCIMLTSNERFYGHITNDLIEFFLVQVSKVRSDKIVIGKSGVEILGSLNYALAFTPMFLESDFPNNEEYLNLSKLISNYSKVLIFHPRFDSVLVQTPIISDITRTQLEINKSTSASKELVEQYGKFIIEPEIKIMAEFFDGQIKILLMESAFLEAELARTASRLITMDSAQNEAQKYLVKQKQLLFNAQRSVINGRILETIAAMNMQQRD